MYGRCRPGEESGPLCWPVLAAGVAVFGASHRFPEHISQMEWFFWDLESCSGPDGQQTTSDLDLFRVQVWLWEVLSSFLVIITSCCIKSTFYCMSQSDQEMVHCCCTE